MKSILTYEGIKYKKGSVKKVNDPLLVEQALQININGESFTVVMQTPDDEKELATGLLYGEDIIKVGTPFDLTVKKNKNDVIDTIDIHINKKDIGSGYLSSRSLLSVSSCGICGKKELDDIDFKGSALQSKENFTIDFLFELQSKMFENQVNFKQTGGSHGAAVFDEKGELLSLYEDIGRHNALDKSIGNLILNNNLEKAKIATFTGRVSYEIISKIFRAKIPLLIAVSAPSSLAIDFAKEYGITVLGFARNNIATCYANSWRIEN